MELETKDKINFNQQERISLIRNPETFNKPDYKSERQHSKDLDKFLGFKIQKIEQKLLQKFRAYDKILDESNRKKHFQGTQTWIGLNPQILQTPYSEISHFLSYFVKYKPKKIIDLGAAYGRIGLVMNAIIPDSTFIGYEILDVRFKEAKRMIKYLSLDNCEMRNENILDKNFKLPKADVYFIYDFSDSIGLHIILSRLAKKISKERFFIVAKGDGVRTIIQLKFPEFWSTHGVIHKKNWSIYSSFISLS